MARIRDFAALTLAGWFLSCMSSCSGESVSEKPDCPGLSRVVSGSFTRVDDRLRWTLTVESMPDAFVIDRASNPDRQVEYAWEVDVDTDGDGMFDYILSINHYKEPGAAERVSTDIMSETDHDIYRLDDSPNSRGPSVGTFEATLSGSTITFDVDATAFPELAEGSTERRSSWVTAYRNGDADQTCWDRWPPPNLTASARSTRRP